MDKRKTRILRFFTFTYLLFGASIIYLLWFNIGISLNGSFDQASGIINISVKNSSIHLIKDLNVFLLDSNGFEKNILSLTELKPGEEKTIELSESHATAGVIALSAKAPFHLPVSKKIQISKTGAGQGEISAELKGPNKAFLASTTSFKVRACNLMSGEEEVKIENKFSRNYFSNPEETKTISLKRNECSEQEFKLSPSRKGKTTIVFNITTKQVNKRLEKEVEIIE